MHTRVGRLVARRLLNAIPVILIVAVGIFVLLELAAGDAVDAYLAGTGGDAAFAERLRREWGLDRSLVVRFLAYMEAVVALDFGRSVAVSMPVLDAIGQRLPVTLLMMGSAVLLSAALGSVLGGIAALHRGRLLDGGIT